LVELFQSKKPLEWHYPKKDLEKLPLRTRVKHGAPQVTMGV